MTRVGGVHCAFRIEDVIEILRPLPVEPIGRSTDRALALVDGVAVIRGAVLPVISGRALLLGRDETADTAVASARFVVLQAGDRRFALRVDAVLDVQRIERQALGELPPLLATADAESVAQLGARDDGLLVVLEAARILSDASWAELATSRSPS